MMIHAYTSFSFSYLNRARVLAHSLKRLHPDWTFWAVITDKEPASFSFDLCDEPFDRVIFVEELYLEDTKNWLFAHDIVEACTAVKGRALKHIMSQPDAEKVFYFDPDTAVFNEMTPIVEMLDDYSIVLTPHQIDPEPKEDRTAIMDNEVGSLNWGVFNLGFLAVSTDSEAKRFSQWWSDRLDEWCHDRVDIGIFVDQKLCNLVPCFFDGVKILRDPGYNVASWNLSQRNMHFDENGTALINDYPLRFFHFTKLGPVGDSMTQRYAQDNVEIYELWWWYREQVNAQSSERIPKGWWYYGTFDNGVKIPKATRELYRDRRDLRDAFPQPFQAGEGSFFAWLQAHTDLLNNDDQKGFVPA